MFPREESNECVSLLIFWGELGVGEILPQLLGQLGEGSMEIKQPQRSLDTTTFFDHPKDLLGKIICGNGI